ncbi:MAG TPA: PKD domain-containing protein [Actinotalea sp.]
MQAATRLGRFATLLGVGAVVLVGLAPIAAQADTMPADPTLPVTVSADGLPTVQINGVAWNQVVVGNTVYVGGSFTSARPAGSPLGTNEIPRANMLAYDLTTGVLIPGFAPSFNAEVLDLTVSPDGTTLYAAGSFTTVDGVNQYRLAAFSTATGALIPSFRPVINSKVNSVTATNSTVFIGGPFSSVNGVARQQLASIDAATGTTTLGLSSAIPDGNVQAVLVSPDGASVVVAGSFTTLNGSSNPGYGLARVDAGTGALLPLPVNTQIRDAGASSGILSLETDGQNFYGTGYHFGAGGNLEGTFSSDWATGSLVWVADCHGDTYSAFPLGGAVYEASHKHYCGNLGGFPQTEPWTYHRGTAVTKAATGVNHPDIYGYGDHPNQAAPSQLTWYPNINTGNYTGQSQGPWTVNGSGDYVLYGGEFTQVNGTDQQGLVRFASSTIAPNLQGPRLNNDSFLLRATSSATGQVQVAFGANYDRDNDTLVYKLYRDTTTVAPIYQRTLTTKFWQLPNMEYTDTGLTPGASVRYKVTATDAFGNTTASSWVTVTVASSGTIGAYLTQVRADEPHELWRLGEPAGTTFKDSILFDNLTNGTGVARGAAGAISGDTDTAATFDGTSNGTTANVQPTNAPDSFSVEAWVKTTSTRGGKIVGFGNKGTGTSSAADRHLYMDNAGKLYFGIQSSAVQTITSPSAYNNGQWHHVVGTFGAGTMRLFVDGKQVAERGDISWVRAYWGWWRIGGDRLTGWTNKPTSDYLAASIDDVAVYDGALSATRVLAHYTASGRTVSVPPVPADSYGAAVRSASPDLYWRLGETSGTQAADTGPVGTNTGTYRTGYTLGSAGALVGVSNTAVTFDGSKGLLSSDLAYVNPTTYSEELWFKTTTTAGGKLIGLGNAQTGQSTSYDRHVWMGTDGRLTFGANPGTMVNLTSPAAYNNGQWHHLVATQGPGGMRLYVDGALVAQNTTTGALNLTGYWRVGSDRTGGPQGFFAGTIDEVAVYTHVLTADQVAQHRNLGLGINQLPTASFTSSVTGLGLTVDGSASTDPDGTIASYDWTFGDGSTGTGATASHTYAASGTYTVTLTVTDNRGGTATTSRTLTATAPNQPPTASFTSSVTDLTASVDGSGSSDPDGTIASYGWSFGDGTTGSGATATHAYASSGVYTITLTVTDNNGATASTTGQVTANAPNPTGALVRDTFTRTVAGGWSFADTGGAWTSTGTASRFSVNGSAGLHTTPAGATLVSSLNAISSTSTEVQVTLSADKVPNGSGAYLSVQGRRVTSTDAYGARVRLNADGSVDLNVTRSNGTPVTGGTVSGLTFAAGDKLQLRLQVDGTSPTTVRAKVWKVGTTEPAAWFASMSDATASLQAPGAIGISSFLFSSATNGPVVFSYDDLWAGAVGTTSNVAPTAAFTSSASFLTASVDGSGSSDSDGTVASYAWDFGDGATGTGVTASHTYAAAGTYPVTLVVTDDKGGTGTVAHSVTVTAPPVNQPPTASFTSSSTFLAASVDGSGSSDGDGTVASYAWDFGDGSTATGVTASHTYAAAGTYSVTLIVTDDKGATGTVAHDITVTANQPPVAAFTSSAVNLALSVDGSGSSDPDGTVATYAWDFGDGGTGSGATASHTYLAGGTYTVTLTVTDNVGATGLTSSAVTVAPADPGALARDTFTRIISGGWGAAENGGSWTSTGTASRFSVNGTAGVHTDVAGGTLNSALTSVLSTNTDLTMVISADKVPNGSGGYIHVQGRRVTATDFYGARVRLYADGSVELHVTRGNGTVVAGGTVAGLTFNAGDKLAVRVQVQGTSPTAVRARIWKVGQPEPTTWNATMSDSTSTTLQVPGGIGITTFLFSSVTNGPVAFSYDDVLAAPVP